MDIKDFNYNEFRFCVVFVVLNLKKTKIKQFYTLDERALI